MMDDVLRGIFCLMMAVISGLVVYYEGGGFAIFMCGFFLAFAISAFADELSYRIDLEDDECDECKKDSKENT